MFDNVPLSPKAYDNNFYAVSPHSFSNYRQGYLDLWSKMSVTKRAEASRQVALIVKNRAVYEDISASCGVPWFVLGLLHLREAGPQDVGRWLCCLHNGEKIIGTGRKTAIVPKGVGPFTTFKAAALDAVRREGLDKIDWAKDGVAYVAFASETFNGFGYRNHGIPSPYLWGGSSVQRSGKYVSDGVFSATAMDPQIGTMTLLKVGVEDFGFTFVGSTPVVKPSPSAPATKPAAPGQTGPKPNIWVVIGNLLSAFFKAISPK